MKAIDGAKSFVQKVASLKRETGCSLNEAKDKLKYHGGIYNAAKYEILYGKPTQQVTYHDKEG